MYIRQSLTPARRLPKAALWVSSYSRGYKTISHLQAGPEVPSKESPVGEAGPRFPSRDGSETRAGEDFFGTLPGVEGGAVEQGEGASSSSPALEAPPGDHAFCSS